ncbi:MAG: NAD-binding protein [Capsulimonadales bacterium]|nr:NAD-binding protein [Capsulimonadales bacterium]
MTDLPAVPDQPPVSERHVIVCGLGRFGLRIVAHLRERGIPVTIITENSRQDRKDAAIALGANIVDGNFLISGVRASAGIDHARALILATSSDAVNLEAALEARNVSANLRIVMRVDSDKVAGRLCADFDIDAALSPPVLSAPAFTRAALEPPPAPAESTSRHSLLPRRIAPRRFHYQPVPVALVTALLALFLSGVFVFRSTLDLGWIDAIYFTATILTTVGFGDIHLKEEADSIKMFGTLLMFGGVTLIAVTSSFLTNFFLSGAATQLRAESQASRLRNHVILCGLGSVGFEVAEDLIARRVPLIIVDATPDDAHARNLSARVPLIVGDATDPVTLTRAGIDRARALIAAVSSDPLNLEIGFTAKSLVQERRPDRPLRIVLRCFDPELSRRIHRLSNAYTVLSSAEISAPLFAEEALKTSATVPRAYSQ